MIRVGGWPRWADTAAAYLASQGFEVNALAFERSVGFPPVSSPGVKLQHVAIPLGIAGKLGWTLQVARRLQAQLRQREFTIQYVMDSWSIPPVWLVTFGCFARRGTRLVYHTFEWLDPSVHSPIHVRLERGICRRADLVVNIDRMKGRLQQMLYRLPRSPLWIRNGFSRHYPLPARSDERRREMLGRNVPPGSLVILLPSVASNDRLALEVLRSIVHLPVRYRFCAIRGENAYFDQCLSEVRRLGIEDRAVWLPRMSFDRLMEYVVSSDIGMVLHDGNVSIGNFMANPMRLAQFSASGIPFVASDFPMLAGDVYRYGLGVCCEEHSPDSIAAAVRELGEGSPTLEERRPHLKRVFQEHLCFESRGILLANALREITATSLNPGRIT